LGDLGELGERKGDIVDFRGVCLEGVTKEGVRCAWGTGKDLVGDITGVTGITGRGRGAGVGSGIAAAVSGAVSGGEGTGSGSFEGSWTKDTGAERGTGGGTGTASEPPTAATVGAKSEQAVVGLKTGDTESRVPGRGEGAGTGFPKFSFEFSLKKMGLAVFFKEGDPSVCKACRAGMMKGPALRGGETRESKLVVINLGIAFSPCFGVICI
jgi:hypothetical protein